jgi:branched-chain amino acid transport system substrate-binding protein
MQIPVSKDHQPEQKRGGFTMAEKKAFQRCGLFLTAFAACMFLLSGAWAAEKKEILIGAPLSLTGILAMDGEEQGWAYEQAVSDVNKSGGIFVKEYGKKLPVRLIVADDESTSGKAAAAVEKLIKIDKVDLLLSTHSTPLILPTCVTAEKYKKYYHATTIWPPLWKEQKFKWSSVLFFTPMQGSEVPFLIWKSLPEADRPRNVALLMEDSIDGQAFGGCFRDSAKNYGYTFVLDEPWAVGAKDYSSQILKAKAKNVDAMLIFGSPQDSITLVRQMKESGLSVKYLHGWKGTWTSEFWKALGKDAQYVMLDGFWSEDYPFPGAKELGERYTKKFNKQSVSTGLYYGLAQILWQAIERAGSLDSAKVRNAVAGGEFKGTVMGDVKYDQDGIALFESTGNQWWDGRQKLVYPAVEGSWKLRLAPPWDKR